MKAQARYMIQEDRPKELIIADIGLNHKSVTNDAEAVVAELYGAGVLGKRKLLYYDSEGKLSELVHDGKGKFLGFSPVKPTK